ncbi:hypothetical protein AgCh_027828 [Apium graveolens]
MGGSIDCSGPVVTSYGGTHSHLPSCLGYFSQKIWSHYSEFQAAVEALAFLDCLHSLAIEPMQLCTIEAMGDAINNALEGDEEEEETEELVSQVLDEIGININSELVNAPSATIAPDAKNKDFKQKTEGIKNVKIHQQTYRYLAMVAMAMAAKAKLLLRELKTVKADLAFAKELCGQLEEENSVIRESRAAGECVAKYLNLNNPFYNPI